jgi:hypothetical protein
MTPFHPWSEDDSDSLDHQIKAERKQHESELGRRRREAQSTKQATTITYTRAVNRTQEKEAT